MSAKDQIYRIPPHQYIHVLDLNTNITRVLVGPKTFIRQDNEKVLMSPTPMITVPPRHYCIIENPVLLGEDGSVVLDSNGQVKLRHSDKEIRSAEDHSEPFALYPGEQLYKNVTPLTIVKPDSALRLGALREFKDGDAVRQAGDEWLFRGPGTYMPRVEVEVLETVLASVIFPNTALRIRARKECVSSDGTNRVTGEEWIVKDVGAYLPGVFEEILSVVQAHVLTEKKALHVRATRTFLDFQGVQRKTGEEWLITMKDCESHIPNVYEEVVGVIDITTLNNRQYAVLLNPLDENGRPNFGARKLIKGPVSFFLQPQEELEGVGIQGIYVLGEDQGIILKAIEAFKDGDVTRRSGDLWMIRGPAEYVPPVEVEIVAQRVAIPLDDNEGIYVRDCKSGKVRAVIGKTYMLNENEELWAKELPQGVEELLNESRDHLADRGSRGKPTSQAKRDKTKVVSLRVPHNAAVQIYDYTEKKARVVFGPELVMLGPDEQFTQLSLSGDKPKKPNRIRALCLLLGPDFCTDVIEIETSDHARLRLQLSYNWNFEIKDKKDPVEAAKLFSVPDFVGDLCKAIASRVRGAVASVKFDDFHRNSAKIIRASVFGYDETNAPRSSFAFAANNLQITSVDIQSAEPVDQRTRDALQKSVQLAIEITTNSQEATARHEAERLEQEAKGRLERQRIKDEAAAENARQELYELQAQCAAVESTGQAKAEAQSRAEAARIEGEAAVEQARLKAQAQKIEAESELERLEAAREAELKYIREQNEMEIAKAKEMTKLEVDKFKNMVDAIGAETIQKMAIAGPEMQVKLLQGLGLQSTLITDGSTPINLFNTAQGLISGGFNAASK